MVVDLLLLVLAVTAAVAGYRLGFVARAASWAGMLLGLFLAARAMPWVLDRLGDQAGRSGLLLVGAGVLLGGAALGQAVGLLVGNRAQVGITSPAARRADALGGAIGGVLGLLVIVWLVVPAAADMAGWPARAVRESTAVQALTDTLPAAPDATRTLRRLLGEGYPQVFEGVQRSPEVGPVPEQSGLEQATADRVAGSIVKVVGEACGRIQEGTGWVLQDGVVVTNAHVVAGEPATTLERPDGSEVGATLVGFDAERDLAVLSAPDLGLPALEVGESAVDVQGAVFGHPGGGPLELSPFVVRQRLDALGTDIYGSPGAERDVLVLAADLAPGDSGSPLVSTDGTVVGVAFAIAPDRDGVAYALSIDELRAVLDEVDGSARDAGPCTA